MRAKVGYRCDLHIHSCLSPCADLLMTPGNIIKEAIRLGLDCIAITDHNTAGNVEVAMKLARESGLEVIPGMEMETKEEVHLLCFFPVLESLMEWEKVVEAGLPRQKNNEEVLGFQILTDCNDQYVAKEERMLATATQLSFAEALDNVTRLGGTVIPSHVDRPVNSIIGQLGFIPPDSGISTVEISRNAELSSLVSNHPYLKEFFLITGSDSHYLHDIGRCGQYERGFPLIEDLYWLLMKRSW